MRLTCCPKHGEKNISWKTSDHMRHIVAENLMTEGAMINRTLISAEKQAGEYQFVL